MLVSVLDDGSQVGELFVNFVDAFPCSSGDEAWDLECFVGVAGFRFLAFARSFDFLAGVSAELGHTDEKSQAKQRADGRAG